MHSEAAFLAPMVIILLASRLLGDAAQRLGQPAVIGQLVAGILLGPSLFGLVWPAAQHVVFPADPSHQRAMLQAFAEFGILLLLALTGMEVDVGLLRKIGSPALSVSFAGITVPFLCGVALGFAAPASLISNPDQRLATALFLGVALSISSIKIVAAVVRELNFARREIWAAHRRLIDHRRFRSHG
jgi:Kef-type K+ transport system membrane component KefB